MLEQHIHLKKLLLVLGVILIGAVVFAAFSLYRTKIQDGSVEQPMIQKDLTKEEKVGKQLEELSKEGQSQASAEEIEQQLEDLSKNNQGAVPTEEEVRGQLDKLSQ